MIYAYDDYVQLPTKDLYDSTIMKMAIDEAKNMYEKGQEKWDDFYEAYGDFMSPFAKDMQKYGDIMKRIQQTVNNAYANGIDLARSPEGRALIQQLTHSIDPGWYNTAKANAKVGYTYLEAIKEAARKGEYNKEFEDWLLQNGGPGLFEDFSSEGGRMWDRTAPGRFQDVNQWTSHLFENIERSYDPTTSKMYPGFMAYTKDKEAMNRIAASNMPFLSSSDQGRYMLDGLKRQYKSEGLSDADALTKAVDSLQKLVVDSNWDQSLKLETDPYYLDKKRTENDNWLDEQKRKRDYKYDLLGKYDLNMNGVLDPDERKIAEKYLTKNAKGGGADAESVNVFREAEAYAPPLSKAHTPIYRYAGNHAGYVQSKSYEQKIDTVVPSNTIHETDSDTKESRIKYEFTPSEIKDNVYLISENGKIHPSQILNNSESSVYTFNPHGNMKATRYGNGYKYYISGTFTNDDNNVIKDPETGSDTVWIEVKERAFNYGETKK